MGSDILVYSLWMFHEKDMKIWIFKKLYYAGCSKNVLNDVISNA